MTSPPAGSSVGSLLVEERIASQASGDLLLARQPGLGRRVLVRSLRRDCLDNPRLVERFRREGRMAASLSHPNVQQAFDLFAWRGDHYLVLEQIEGGSLRACLDRLGRPPAPVGHRIALEIARGVEALHAAGVIHADLCPENVGLARDGSAKITGLGWARGAAEQEVPAPEAGSFTAPEIARGNAPDWASDVFALAALIVEILGAQPGHSVPGHPRALARQLRRALDPEPSKRPSAGSLRTTIESSLSDPAPAVRASTLSWLAQGCTATSAPPEAQGDRTRARRPIGRLAVGAGALAGLVAALVAGRDLRMPWPASSSGPTGEEANARVPVEPPSVDAGIAAAPEAARLRFAVYPWGEIRIDGGAAFLTPSAAPTSLEPGTHRIEIQHPSLGNVVREVTLAPGEERTLRHVFDRIPLP